VAGNEAVAVVTAPRPIARIAPQGRGVKQTPAARAAIIRWTTRPTGKRRVGAPRKRGPAPPRRGHAALRRGGQSVRVRDVQDRLERVREGALGGILARGPRSGRRRGRRRGVLVTHPPAGLALPRSQRPRSTQALGYAAAPAASQARQSAACRRSVRRQVPARRDPRSAWGSWVSTRKGAPDLLVLAGPRARAPHACIRSRYTASSR